MNPGARPGQDSRHTLTDPLLYGDLVSIATPAVKWAQEVTHPDQIPILVRRAFHDCQTAPTGPVFLSLPMDVGRHNAREHSRLGS